MSRTVVIPGGSAVLRDPGEMTERQRRAVRGPLLAVAADLTGGEIPADGHAPETVHLTPGVGGLIFQIRDAAIVAALISWTLELPLPTLESVQDLPGDVYDALVKETEGVFTGLGVDFSPSPDPESPTRQPSSSSGLLADVQSQSTLPSPTVGVSTPTASSTG